MSGEGVRPNKRYAINWFKKSAAQRYPKALEKLSDINA
jgi:TPR repeat protein